MPFANLLATQELTRTGATFASLLTRNDSVDDAPGLARRAGLVVPTSGAHPDAALLRARNTTEHVRHEMQKVTIEGPSFVTMSSAEGPVQITVVNGLDEEVTVAVRRADPHPRRQDRHPRPGHARPRASAPRSG